MISVLFGRSVGSVARQNDLKVCKVIKISEKMLRAKPINGYSRGGDGWLVYSSATIKLDGPDAMAYVLKNLK